MAFDDFKVTNYPKSLVSPEMYGRHLSRLFTGDVIDGLTVVPGTGLQVVLEPGNAFIRYGSADVASARFMSLVDDYELTIATADVSNPRIDLVVVYVDNDEDLPDGEPTSANLDGVGVAKAAIVQGTPASSPSAPNSTAIQSAIGAANPYTIVAQVRVNAGVSVIDVDKITDVRDVAQVPTARIEDAAVTSSKIDFTTSGGIWWEELKRTTLTSVGDTISLTDISPRKHIAIIGTLIPTGGTVDMSLTFNNDTGSNYSAQRSSDFGSESNLTSQSSLSLATSASNELKFFRAEFINLQAQEKLGVVHVVESGGSGASNPPDNRQAFLKWANTSAQITRVDVVNGGTGDYAVGSEVVIIGHD